MTSVSTVTFKSRNTRVPDATAQGNDPARTTFHIDRATWGHHEKGCWQMPLVISRSFFFSVSVAHMCGSRCGFLGSPERVCRLRRPG